MSEQVVNRYVTTCDCMSEAAWGDYVRHSDYDALRTQVAELRAQLDQRIPCDVMLPPATTIKRGCQLSTVLVSMKMREDVPPNQRVFTATPAPEVQCKECNDTACDPKFDELMPCSGCATKPANGGDAEVNHD